MFERLIKTATDYIVIIFLVLCFLSHTFFNSEFKWSSLANTDGLTLLAIVLALFASISIKIPVIRKLIGAILLKLNFHHLDYSIELKVLAPETTTTSSEIFDIFMDSIISGNFSSNDFDMKYEDINKISFFHRAIAGNVEITKTAFTEQGLNFFSIKIDGVSAYRSIEKNARFLGNRFLEDLSNKRFILKNIFIRIVRKNTEYKIAHMGLLLSARKYDVQSSHTEIKSNMTTKIIIDSNNGVSMISTSRADFIESIEALKTVLMS